MAFFLLSRYFSFGVKLSPVAPPDNIEKIQFGKSLDTPPRSLALDDINIQKGKHRGPHMIDINKNKNDL